MVRVYRITSTTRAGARPLYEAAATVFELPAYDAVLAWLFGGSAPELAAQTQPHAGPSIALMTSVRGVEAAVIETNGGRRISVTDKQTVIEFPLPGSVIAAGEIIRQCWDAVPMDNWAQVTFVDGTREDLDDYVGPMGRHLYLARLNASREQMLGFACEYGWSISGCEITDDNLDAFIAACAWAPWGSGVITNGRRHAHVTDQCVRWG
jgi:hypothetical protein